MIKSVAKRVGHALLDTWLGRADYYRRLEHLQNTLGGPFNGQNARRKLFHAIVSACKPTAIVETGTCRGDTTDYMACAVDVPIFSVEYSKRYFSFAKARLRHHRHVHLVRGDSRAFLCKLIQSGRLDGGTIFAYFDAHWSHDLPLAEEIAIIFSKVSSAVAMVDDFEVPWDRGYAFDDYGPGKSLTVDYILPSIKKWSLVAFGPSTASQEETGARRGCLVLTDKAMASTLDTIVLLNRH
jgi:hypothetical protein